jgi:hypothetical protein
MVMFVQFSLLIHPLPALFLLRTPLMLHVMVQKTSNTIAMLTDVLLGLTLTTVTPTPLIQHDVKFSAQIAHQLKLPFKMQTLMVVPTFV